MMTEWFKSFLLANLVAGLVCSFVWLLINYTAWTLYGVAIVLLTPTIRNMRQLKQPKQDAVLRSAAISTDT